MYAGMYTEIGILHDGFINIYNVMCQLNHKICLRKYRNGDVLLKHKQGPMLVPL